MGGRAAKEATMQVNKARERKLGFCVAGVAFGDSRGAFAWQAWTYNSFTHNFVTQSVFHHLLYLLAFPIPFSHLFCG